VKINRQLFKLFVFTAFLAFTASAHAAVGGTLKSGNQIILKPQEEYALSITRTAGKYSSNSNYNFTMSNNGDIIYEDKNQVDDVYLVFNDGVQSGDRIKIFVNRGFFDYKITPVNTLPNIVKNVIDPEVLARANKPKPARKKVFNKPIAEKPVVEAKSTEAVVTEEVLADDERISEPSNVQSKARTKAPLNDDFFDKFKKVLAGLVDSFFVSSDTKIAQTVEKEVAQKSEKKAPVLETKNPMPSFNKQFDDSALKKSSKQETNTFSKKPKGLNRSFDDNRLKQVASGEQSPFSAPKRGISETFDDSALQESAIVNKRVFTKAKAISIESTLPTGTVAKTFGGRGKVAEKRYKEQFSKEIATVPNFRPTSSFAEPALPKTKIVQAEVKPHFTESPKYMAPRTPAPAVEEKIIMPSAPQPVVEQPRVVAPVYDDRTEAYPDTGYKAGYESLAPKKTPVARQTPRPAVQEDRSLQNRVTTIDDGEEKRLVITKRIDKKEDPFAGRVLGNINDRAVGGGYNGAVNLAKLGMRVTKNSRPVSAWIEVFKNGTKQRVKTFYTSKTPRAKSVKLPAGNYMVRATYRTRDSKQQKTLKNIRLSEGDSVNKKIAFYDGKLRVVARRGDQPLYVKVVAYKSASRDRVGYDFSSRTSGVAELSLSSGRYDIEVIDHKNNRLFDGIRISGGKTNTINVDF